VQFHPPIPTLSHHFDTNSNSVDSCHSFFIMCPLILILLSCQVQMEVQEPRVVTQVPTWVPPLVEPQLVWFPTPLLPFVNGPGHRDFNHLINDPLLHNPTWLEMSKELPSNILRFEGNPREGPTNHVHPFHMWCSSNSITNDSIHLWLFQCMVTEATTKWYVDNARATHSTLATLFETFISYF